MRKLNLKTRYCENCKNEIIRNTRTGTKRINTKQYVKARFCSIKCKGIVCGKENSGKNNPNYRGGKNKCTDCKKELNKRIAQNIRCRECYIKKLSIEKNKHPNYPACVNCSGRTGDYKSILCKNCCRGAFRKSWKGGVSSIYSLVRNSPENRQWIKQCMYRDNYTCQECGIESIKSNLLQVHHLKQFALIFKKNNIKSINEAKECKELWDINNGVTLCRNCHKLTESYAKKL